MTSYAQATAPVPAGRANRPLQDLTDEQLVVRIKQNDEQAFACLLRRHVNSIHAYLLRLTGSRADSDDLTQETFLRVWQKAHTFKPGKVRFSTWLHQIGHNLAIDLFRRRGPTFTQTAVADAQQPGPDADHAAAVQRTRVHRALTALPENQRHAILLCHQQGFSNKEAAAILGVGVRALESLLARARRTLKAELNEVRT